jgi:amphi-Trp domain-containing protein
MSRRQAPAAAAEPAPAFPRAPRTLCRGRGRPGVGPRWNPLTKATTSPATASMLPGRCQRDNCSPGSTAQGTSGRVVITFCGISTDFAPSPKLSGRVTLRKHSRPKVPLVSIPSRFRGRTRREAAAFYLSELAQAILAGEFDVVTGHDTVRLQPSDVVVLGISVSRSLRVDHVSVQIRWPRRRHAQGTGLPARRRGSPPGRPEGHLEFTSVIRPQPPGASPGCGSQQRGDHATAG